MLVTIMTDPDWVPIMKCAPAIFEMGDDVYILDRRIDELETKIADDWDQMSSAAREKTQENLKTLRKKRNEVAEKYGSLKAGSADAWEEMKQGFSEAFEALSDAWAKSVDEFDSNK